MIPRRSPGQRRRRTRRDDELAQVEAVDPDKHRELVELRRYNPQAFRKELRRWIQRGHIRRGRGFEVPEEALRLLEGDAVAVREAVEAGGYDFRAVSGLYEEEAAGRARPEVLAWLAERREALLAAENRALR